MLDQVVAVIKPAIDANIEKKTNREVPNLFQLVYKSTQGLNFVQKKMQDMKAIFHSALSLRVQNFVHVCQLPHEKLALY